jgi:hypothetical protein
MARSPAALVRRWQRSTRSGANMRARRITAGPPEFRLLQDEQEIGYVDGGRVSFRGFTTRDDAALAASVAHQALTRRRGEQPHSVDEPKDILVVYQGSTQAVIARAGILARLLPPAPEDSEVGGWGFEIELLPKERFEVFAIARARVMWRALRGTGIDRRMHQFGAQPLTSA